MLTLARGDATLVIDPGLGARAASLVVDGLELLGRGGDDPVQWGWYPMAPWPGRIRGNIVRGWDGAEHALRPSYQGWAMHGTVLARAWAVETADASSATLVCALGPDWPWPGEVRQTWALGDQWVDCALEVVAAGEHPYPVELGWHPWFRRDLGRGGRAQILLDAVGQVERGARPPADRAAGPGGAARVDRGVRRRVPGAVGAGGDHLAGCAHAQLRERLRVVHGLLRAARGGVPGAADGSGRRAGGRPEAAARRHPQRPQPLDLAAALRRPRRPGLAPGRRGAFGLD